MLTITNGQNLLLRLRLKPSVAVTIVLAMRVGVREHSVRLWVLENTLLDCGCWRTLCLIVGVGEPSVRLWVLENTLLDCGCY